MNEMSSKIEVPPWEEDLGHLFRSRLSNKCAIIEGRCTQLLQSASIPGAVGNLTKVPHLFGQKLAAVRRLAEASDSAFKNPATVIEILDAFMPYADLRSDVAHSRLRTVQTDTGQVLYLFENLGLAAPKAAKKARVFTAQELNDLYGEAKRHANRFCRFAITK